MKVVDRAYICSLDSHVADSPLPSKLKCHLMEDDIDKWLIPQGTEDLGAIVTEFPQRFGHYLLTTNFDPLLAIAIRRARGEVTQTALHGDSNPGSVVVRGCPM